MSAPSTDVVVWQRLQESYGEWLEARRAFLTSSVNRVGLLRHALRSGDRQAALAVLPLLPLDERMQLFPEMVHLARAAHGPFAVAWDAIAGLPRDWVLAHVEAEVDPLLAREEEDDYWMFLQLYERLDRALAGKLARRAAAHADPTIRELGDEYLAKLSAPAANGADL